jgi:hypothetical protein
VADDFLGFFLIDKIEEKKIDISFIFLFEGISYSGKAKKNLRLQENYFYGGIGRKQGYMVDFDAVFFIENTLLFSYFASFLEFCRIPGITKKVIEKVPGFGEKKFFYLWQENLFSELNTLLNYSAEKILEIESEWKEKKKSGLMGNV